jgi:hypothetical protein
MHRYQRWSRGVGCQERVCVANPGLFPAAQMGVGEGKSIGQWYGPNTVAQVLKYVLSPIPSASLGQCKFSLAFTFSLSIATEIRGSDSLHTCSGRSLR